MKGHFIYFNTMRRVLSSAGPSSSGTRRRCRRSRRAAPRRGRALIYDMHINYIHIHICIHTLIIIIIIIIMFIYVVVSYVVCCFPASEPALLLRRQGPSALGPI